MHFRHRFRPRPPYRLGRKPTPRPPGPSVGRRLLLRAGLRLGEHLLFNPTARERARALLAALWHWLPFD